MVGRAFVSGLIALRRWTYVLMLGVSLASLVVLLQTDTWAALGAARPAVAEQLPAGLRVLTTGSHMDGFPVWAPDGNRIAFMRDGRIWVMAATGQQARALSSGRGGWDVAPAWRPDGKQIALIRLDSSNEVARIMTVDPASGKEEQLLREEVSAGYLAWSRDGKALYYTTAKSLKRLDIAAKRAQTVVQAPTDGEMLAGGLALSPDGKRAIFGASSGGGSTVQYDLWSIALDQPRQRPERLTQGGGIMPSLDHTGTRLIYRSPRQATGIYLMELPTHTTRRILADTEGRVMYFHPSFAPGGRQIALSRLRLEAPAAGQEGRFISHICLLSLTEIRAE